MGAAKYYGLVGSLPWLPHFEAAEFVPITEMQVASRLSALSDAHRRELDAAASLLLWPRQPRERPAEFLLERYAQVVTQIETPALREYVEYRMGQRTVVVALRMRRQGQSPRAGEAWGVGRWARKIAAHWDDTDFRMGAVYPWIDRARNLLDETDALGLERLQLDAVWQQLTRIESMSPFGFERVFAFVFKWDIVRRWLTYDANLAKDRFQSLITEVIRDHEQLFA